MYYYQNSHLKNLIDSCGLSYLIFPPSIAYPKLVQQVYTNLEYNGDCYTFFVKGKSLFFIVMDLGSILSIPFTRDYLFTPKDAVYTPYTPLKQLQTVMDDPTLTTMTLPKTIDVSPTAMVLHKLLRYNLLLRIGGGADFTYQDLVLVALLLKGKTLNFSLMMLKHMVNFIKHSKKCLPL